MWAPEGECFSLSALLQPLLLPPVADLSFTSKSWKEKTRAFQPGEDPVGPSQCLPMFTEKFAPVDGCFCPGGVYSQSDGKGLEFPHCGGGGSSREI